MYCGSKGILWTCQSHVVYFLHHPLIISFYLMVLVSLLYIIMTTSYLFLTC